MKKTAIIVLLIAAFLAACGPAVTPTPAPAGVPPIETSIPATATVAPRSLTIFGAASLTGAFSEIGKNFEAAHPGVSVKFSFAGSQTLSTQLTQGATADVFASANHTEMDKVVTASLIQKDAPKDLDVGMYIA